MATCCQNGCTPVITKPFCRMAGMNRPTTVPKIVPTPPNRLVPPMTTAAMTARLVLDWPAMAVVDYWASDRIPATPARHPESA